MITRDEVLMGRDKMYPLSPELELNLAILLGALNKFRTAYGKPLYVSSGYRPDTFNNIPGAAKKSNHKVCLACDFKDDGTIATFCKNNTKLLEECNLFLENPDKTIGWVHLQVVEPKSGNRIFNP